ncbi:Arf-GAP with SH3 domain, ANK repeat and PH domain-containing protein 1 [Anabarilius grahami]|uniref:Arf-GAP with SH3 domain, ANK repeat and PH domain-containing protein 1 n=1 Tax=Anabarilius grahami TaxID=495550 RepID=A0A3N0XVA5_ANAGA|nr:Arf-GAP with SH3 domain, ANK repeat and PH domain-containing protein 1 [Anabarilius grahami]
MPDQISVSEFLSETTEDYNSPTTSSFTTRLQSCRNTVSVLEELLYHNKNPSVTGDVALFIGGVRERTVGEKRESATGNAVCMDSTVEKRY